MVNYADFLRCLASQRFFKLHWAYITQARMQPAVIIKRQPINDFIHAIRNASITILARMWLCMLNPTT